MNSRPHFQNDTVFNGFPPRSRTCERGFTIIEIVAVLALIAIISAVAVSRFSSTEHYNLRTSVEVIKGHLRYAQARAMDSDAVWGIQFSSDSYFLFRNGNAGNRVLFLGEDSTTVSLPAGMAITAGTVSFDTWGVPYTDQSASAQQSSARVLTVTYRGEGAVIAITPSTGFIE